MRVRAGAMYNTKENQPIVLSWQQLSVGDNVLYSVTCSSCGANKSSLYDELPQLITAEPCAKRPSRHTPGTF